MLTAIPDEIDPMRLHRQHQVSIARLIDAGEVLMKGIEDVDHVDAVVGEGLERARERVGVLDAVGLDG